MSHRGRERSTGMEEWEFRWFASGGEEEASILHHGQRKGKRGTVSGGKKGAIP